jgi:cytochrome c-type protein NapB
MKRSEKRNQSAVTAVTAVTAFCLTGILLITVSCFAADNNLDDFDNQSRKLYRANDSTPEMYMSADSGGRTLADFYSLRQYPGSPPRIPHPVDLTFSGKETDCLSCHAKGGYSQEFGKFVPVTPHPENTLCYQCHVPVTTEEKFVETNWKSISPPLLGRPFLGGSPPPIPHTLQLRENCIACHTGPGAVAEIQVTHAARGNCRQCHVPAVQTAPLVEFQRK